MEPEKITIGDYTFTLLDTRGPDGWKTFVSYPTALPNDYEDYAQVTGTLDKFVTKREGPNGAEPAWEDLPAPIIARLLGSLTDWYKNSLKN